MSRFPPQSMPYKSVPPASRVAFIAVCGLLAAAPFEAAAPLVDVPGQRLTGLEACIAAGILAWIAWSVWTRTRPALPRRLVAPWTATLAALLVAALAAPGDRINALHFVGRLVAALAVAIMAANALVTDTRINRALSVAVGAAAVASGLIVVEYLGPVATRGVLSPFHATTSRVGDLVRASGPFQYPTIASMYLEVAFALGLGVFVGARARRHVVAGVATAAVLLLFAQAILLTFTRAGLVTMLLALGCTAAFTWRDGRDRALLAMLGALGAAILIMATTSRSLDSIRLRATSEGQEGWYRARFAPPGELRLAARSAATIPITVTNEGRLTWDSDASSPFYLSYHWLASDSDRIVTFEGLRTAFDEPIPSGVTVTVSARVEAPPRAGRYRIAWDVVQEDRLWFSTEPGARLATTPAVISGAAASAGAIPTRMYPSRAVRPGRAALWRAAIRMIADRPLFGVGPDNFRLRYGSYLGLDSADRRVHSNNLYLELLAGGGLIGGGVALWFLWRATRVAVVDAWRTRPAAAARVGVAAAWVAILTHGLVDSFFAFTPIYLLTALTLGLAVAVRACGDLTHADCV